MQEITEEQANKAVAKVKENLTPATFDFLEAVNDRSYPEDDVIIFLDDQKIKEYIDLYNRRAMVEAKFAKAPKSVKLAEEHAALDDEYNALVEKLQDSKYIVKIRGIAPDANQKLEDKALEEFPTEYDEVVSPITAVVTKTEKPNPKFQAYYATLLRQAHLVSVTAPNGAVDADWESSDKVAAMMGKLPFLARTRVDEAINEATITADFYQVLVDPVF